MYTLFGAACSSVESEEDVDEWAEVRDEIRLQSDNQLLTVAELTGENEATLTARDVEEFLADETVFDEKFYYFKGRYTGVRRPSALSNATVELEGREVSAAQAIFDAARENRVSVVYMIARLELEASLITGEFSSSKLRSRMQKATGCACPDGKPCSAKHAGFDRQVACAAELTRSLYEQAVVDQTVSGWSIGEKKRTLDKCHVTPADASTAALYTYTPWVGAMGKCATRSRTFGGASAIVPIYRAFLPWFQRRIASRGEDVASQSTDCPTPSLFAPTPASNVAP